MDTKLDPTIDNCAELDDDIDDNDDDDDCCSTIKWNRLSDVCTEENLIDLQTVENVYIYFRYPLKNNGRPPEPLTNDDDYLLPINNVILPTQSYVKINYQGTTLPKWELIEKVFSNEIKSIYELEKAIKIYNPNWSHIKFDILSNYVNFELNETERNEFFNQLLPNIIRLALSLPNLICFNLACLESEQSSTVFLTQEQISSLIANAFLCTYHEDLTKKNRRCINFTK